MSKLKEQITIKTKKQCSQCKRWKQRNEFNKKHWSCTGNLRSECKKCEHTYKQKYFQVHKREKQMHIITVMNRLKINGCAICSYSKCAMALTFHHTNPKDKSFGLNQCCLHRSNEKVATELNKCILLCCRCHREIHSLEYRIDDLVNMYQPKEGEK